MKINILYENVQDVQGMKVGLMKAQTLLAGIGINASFDYNQTSKQFTSLPLNTDVVIGGYEVNPADILSEEKSGYDVTCLIFNPNTIFPHPTNPCTNSNKAWNDTPMQIPVTFYSNLKVFPIITYPDTLVLFFLHELSHYFAFQSGNPDLTHMQGTNPAWSNKQPTDYYLFLIKNNMQIPTSSHFTPLEVSGLENALLAVLYPARELSKVPYVLTSGFRTPAENAKAGGEPNSAHLRGLAVDIATPSNSVRDAVLRGIYGTNMACFVEIAKNHIHLDVDSSIHSLGQTMWSLDD